VLSIMKKTSSLPGNRPLRAQGWNTKRALMIVVAAGTMMFAAETQVSAQGQSRYTPLNQTTPPGMAGRWAALAGKAAGNYFQPVQVGLPEGGNVTTFGTPGQPPHTMPSSGQVGMLIGRVYRIKISDLPGHPGAELYPSIELIDRLHPPRGRAADFPIPVTFSEQEIELALDGRMITKVIYLEQPQLANPIKVDAKVPVEILRPEDNPFAAADLLGRPMAIVRLGGRLPVSGADNGGFFGHGAPVLIPQSGQTAQIGRERIGQALQLPEFE
jgi:hypothetical protein